MLNNFIRQLAKELEVESSFATEVPGVFEFPVDENISVILSEIPLGFSMTCTFSPCPEDNSEEFFTQALLANLYFQGTDGCVLGLDAEAKNLILCKKVDYTIDYNEFRDLIEDFLNSVDFWQEEAKAFGVKLA